MDISKLRSCATPVAIPKDLSKLIHGQTVESDRLEFKADWNPKKIVQSMCAFANDLQDRGGGFIVLGIADADGRASLPPKGVPADKVDAYQKKLTELGHQLQPSYQPLVSAEVFQGQHIIVVWCPAGEVRPYSAPEDQGNKTGRAHYIRVGSVTKKAKGEGLRQLQEVAARVPYDDRLYMKAGVEILDLGLIREFLQAVNSGLYPESHQLPVGELADQMRIARERGGELYPTHTGLLFFTPNPERYFHRAWIEVVWHKDDSLDNFSERTFKGPLDRQLTAATDFIKHNIVQELVRKRESRAEADRFFNYPFAAIEEALANAVYHKSYALAEPIEVQIYPDRITVLSIPGPMPPLDREQLHAERIPVARRYRNRMIGDFLKELGLTEGRATGLPKIRKAMQLNGSPAPVFETDAGNTYFLTELPIHPEALKSNPVNDQVKPFNIKSLKDIQCLLESASNPASNLVSNSVKRVLEKAVHDKVGLMLREVSQVRSQKELLEEAGLTDQAKNRRKYFDPLLTHGWIQRTQPDVPTSPTQAYRLTETGQRLLDILNQATT